MESRIVYFDERGSRNTEATLGIARDRARELGIRQVVIASTHGGSALRAAELLKGAGIEVVAVSISAAFDDVGWTMSAAERLKLEQHGVRVLTSLHAFADGVAEGLLGPATPGSIVADTLRFFSQGMKVIVETSLMAVEAGIVPAGSEIIAVAGTDEGSDTAVVLRPSFARKIKELRVCEILCKPRLA